MERKRNVLFCINRALPLILLLGFNAWMRPILESIRVYDIHITIVGYLMLNAGYTLVHGILIGWFLCDTLTVSLRRKSTWAVFILLVLFSFGGILLWSIPFNNLFYDWFGTTLPHDTAFSDVGQYFQAALGAMLFLILKFIECLRLKQ